MVDSQSSFGYLTYHQSLKPDQLLEWPVSMGDTDENQLNPYKHHIPPLTAFDDKVR